MRDDHARAGTPSMSAACPTTIPESHPFAGSTAKMGEMHEHLSSSGTLRAEHGVVEEWVRVEGRELLRLMYQAHLRVRGSAEQRVEVRGADGVVRGDARPRERGLETVFGDVNVVRLLSMPPPAARAARRSTRS